MLTRDGPAGSTEERRPIVGVIGGMGPLATAAFMQTLVRMTPAGRDQDHLHVVVDSNPGVPDRTAFILGRGEDPRPALVAMARRLAQLGCEVLVMPCNTAHAFTESIAAAVSTPLVDWIDTAVQHVVDLAPGAVGVLATDGTLAAGLYQRALAARRIPVVIPDTVTQAAVMNAIYGATGLKTDGASQRDRVNLIQAAQSLGERGADLVILGCTELALAMPPDDPAWPVRVVDPAIVVAGHVVSLCLGNSRIS